MFLSTLTINIIISIISLIIDSIMKKNDINEHSMKYFIIFVLIILLSSLIEELLKPYLTHFYKIFTQ